MLDAGILPRADDAELLAFDPHTQELRDSATHRRVAAMKRYVLKNWGSHFALRICARGAVSEEIRGTLGLANFFQAVGGEAQGTVHEPGEALAAAQRFRVEDADVWAWVGATVRFPGGRLRHVVVRDVRVTLIEPRRPTPAQARGPGQLSLGLSME
jgi:hypothetical protein